MTKMQPAIEYQMLTRLQSIWGNSHDVILGMLLWLHALPAIPLHSIMHYCIIKQKILTQGKLQRDPICKKILIYHKVLYEFMFANCNCVDDMSLFCQIQNRQDYIDQYDMQTFARNISGQASPGNTSTADSLSQFTIESESVEGIMMSHNIDMLIRSANVNPPRDGNYNMYWHGGRVHSTARDVYLATVLHTANGTLRPFDFSDCGQKPKQRRFEVGFVCSQSRFSVGRCCNNQTCQKKYMAGPFPARGLINF